MKTGKLIGLSALMLGAALQVVAWRGYGFLYAPSAVFLALGVGLIILTWASRKSRMASSADVGTVLAPGTAAGDGADSSRSSHGELGDAGPVTGFDVGGDGGGAGG